MQAGETWGCQKSIWKCIPGNFCQEAQAHTSESGDPEAGAQAVRGARDGGEEVIIQIFLFFLLFIIYQIFDLKTCLF